MLMAYQGSLTVVSNSLQMMQRCIKRLTHKYKQITFRVMSIIQKAGPISGEFSLSTKKCKKFHVGNKDINVIHA